MVVKNAYLQYFLYVFMMDVNDKVRREINLDDVPQMLDKLILADVAKSEQYINILPQIARKGKY
jgi:hypothetical protein